MPTEDAGHEHVTPVECELGIMSTDQNYRHKFVVRRLGSCSTCSELFDLYAEKHGAELKRAGR